jgi:hypothetical protein
MFSAGFPTGVQGHLPHLTQRTSFPLPSSGQATRPPGGSTAQQQLFKSTTAYSRLQPATGNAGFRFKQPAENSNTHAQRQAKWLWERSSNCGKHDILARGSNSAPKGTHRSPILFQPHLDRELFEAGPGPYGREIIPRSVKPLTKNCMASATSSNPIILTRIRIPVSPMNARTRPAPASTQ